MHSGRPASQPPHIALFSPAYPLPSSRAVGSLIAKVEHMAINSCKIYLLLYQLRRETAKNRESLEL